MASGLAGRYQTWPRPVKWAVAILMFPAIVATLIQDNSNPEKEYGKFGPRTRTLFRDLGYTDEEIDKYG